MPDSPNNARRRNTIIAIAILIIILLLLLLIRCPAKKPPAPLAPAQPAATTPAPAAPAATTPPVATPDERLTPATITAPERAPAGSTFSLTWTGPDNPADYIMIVPKDAPNDARGPFAETKAGSPLDLTAPLTAGPHEIRYITSRSRTILGRAAIEVTPITATLDAPAEVPLGAPFSITWTGPSNKGDYITIVAKDAADQAYADYAETSKGSPMSLTAPSVAGDHELRYITGSRTVLARRPIKVAAAQVSLSGPDSAVAGTTILITWTGPNNKGDYITIVPADFPDGRYGNYTDTSKGSPMNLLTPIMAGPAELRYMTGQGANVLARRAITITAAQVTLSAPAEVPVESDVSITWTGPDNPGDYITIVPKSTPDGQYGPYTLTTKGSPLTVKLPKTVGGQPGAGTGDAEVRYMTGQGNKVLARIPIKITP